MPSPQQTWFPHPVMALENIKLLHFSEEEDSNIKPDWTVSVSEAGGNGVKVARHSAIFRKCAKPITSPIHAVVIRGSR